MDFPLSDDNSDRQRIPWVTWSLIAANVVVFVLFQQGGKNDDVTLAFCQVPAEIVTGKDIVTEPTIREVEYEGEQYSVSVPGLRPTPIPVYLTLLTGIFLHGGWMHLLGNMWFLFIFGDNVEDDMGHARYLMYYLAAGVLASLAFVFLNARGDEALTPCLGASGAISGVLGGYLVLHPNRRVSVILFRFIMDVPGYVAVGIYFLMQVVLGLSDTGGGVAYSAHVAGFIAGLILAKPLSDRDVRRQADQLVAFRRRHKGR